MSFILSDAIMLKAALFVLRKVKGGILHANCWFSVSCNSK